MNTVIRNYPNRYGFTPTPTLTLRFYGAVVAAVKSHFDNNESFSVHDITSFVRDKVNSGEWELMGRGANYKILHKNVKGIIEELYDNNLFPRDVKISHHATNNGSQYRLFSPLTIPIPATENAPDGTAEVEAHIAELMEAADVAIKELAAHDDDPFEENISLTISGVRVERLGHKVNVTSPTGKVFSL
jgi:hypothetical protein